MATTKLADVEAQIQEIWSPLFMDELREQLLLAGLVDKRYEGDIRKKNDTVKVSQIDAPSGELRDVGTDADSFSTEALTTRQIEIKADKRAVASFEFEDLIEIQSQIDSDSPEIREALMFAVNKQVNDYLYTLVSPSTTTPDHVLTVATLDADELADIRQLASEAKWLQRPGWWMLLSPGYYNDLLKAQTLTSADFVSDRPVIGGQIVNQRFGFNIVEDNSRSGKTGIAFHPDFMHLVMQTEPRFKISDKHVRKEFGHIISVDMVFGAKLGIDGDIKHIQFTS